MFKNCTISALLCLYGHPSVRVSRILYRLHGKNCVANQLCVVCNLCVLLVQLRGLLEILCGFIFVNTEGKNNKVGNLWKYFL
jgi:hypothetical protein